ncbi:M20/M25/M40 family metallo-hydrolase [Xanthomonadaceae bacterium JHOS43]|nr:M20/M25/M40 family metallo-hydrolase [Xanthomonadaceae bacterium JHOS43]
MTMSFLQVRRWLLAAMLASASGAHAAPDRPQFVVTSAETLSSSSLRHLPSDNATDSLGTALKLLELNAAQQHLLTEHVHHQEGRCGGYFAFDSRREAEDFLANGRALQAMLATAGMAYNIDNQGTVEPWLLQVTEANIRATIAHLSSYQNRYYASPHGATAANWIANTWLALGGGRSDVQVELFTECSNCSTQPSVILTVQGAALPDEVIVVGAHLDSIRSGAGSEPEQFAPGADDDASGIAVITEVIRIALANGWRPQRTIKFMGYAAEEMGLRGSRAIAQNFAAIGIDVVGVLQLDMTNYRSGVSHHFHFISDRVNGPLLAFSKTLFDAYLVPRGFVHRDISCGYACSDHASWTENGFPSVMASEPGSPSNSFYPGLHTASDTLAGVGGTADASIPFAYFGLAFIGELAKTSSGTFLDGFEATTLRE